MLVRALSSGLVTINSAVARAGLGIAALFLFGMVGLVLAQVFFRYVVNDSLVWAEELSKGMMVWVAFLVAPMAMRQGANVKIEMLVEALPARLRIFLSLLINLAVLWILFIFLEESFGLWQRGLQISAASLPIPMAVFYSIVPIGFIALIFVAFELIVRDLQGLIDPSKEWRQDSGPTSKSGENM